jgi:glycerophosphoryl diester phosphodiesterase
LGRRPLVIAHRGASGQRPENTLPAYQRAVELEADMIEIDLHVTADGAVVIRHDSELAGLGEIADASLAEVRSVDAGEGERIPTLDEVLDAFGARIPFNLELKCSARGPYPGLEERALEAVGRRGLEARTLFSCFEDAVLARLRRASPRARIALLFSPRRPEDVLERARALGAEAVNPWHGLASAELLDTAHAAGLAVYPFTVDAVPEMRRLLELGADGLFTNYPDRMRALVGYPRGE